MDPLSEPPKFLTFKGIRFQYSDRHYHFGQNNDEGSTHALFGKKYPLEIHSNFYQSKFGTPNAAYNHPNGLLTLAELYEVDHTLN